MDLATAVKKYLEFAGEFGRAVHLSAFGLSRQATEKAVAAFDEDYQISRYISLTREPEDALVSFPAESRVYLVNGFEVTHLSFQPGVRKLL